MDDGRARRLLAAERSRVEGLLEADPAAELTVEEEAAS